MPLPPKPNDFLGGSGNALVASRVVKSGSNQPNEPPVIISPRTGKPKRRKATRACVHCQRTHLTCDNDRPCERCVARGLAATCRDGVRKKAKYLVDVSESVANSDESLKYDPRYNAQKPTKRAQNEKIQAEPGPQSGEDSQQYGNSETFEIPLMGSDTAKSIPSEAASQPDNSCDRAVSKPSAVGNFNATQSLLNIDTTLPFNSLLGPVNNPLEINLDSTSNLIAFDHGPDHSIHDTQESGNALAHDSQFAPTTAPMNLHLINPASQASFDMFQYLSHDGVDQTELNDPNSWLYNLQMSHHSFRSVAVNMEYSVLGCIINSAPSSSLDIGQPYSSISGARSPSFSKQENATRPAQDNDVFELNDLGQYVLGVRYETPLEIRDTLKKLNPIVFNDTQSGHAQSLPELVEMVEALRQVEFAQRQQKALAAGTQLWMVPETPSGPRRPLSFTICDKATVPLGMSAGSGVDRSVARGAREFSQPAEIYANVKSPYSYTPSYHQLTIYIRTRFTREQQLRIARSMASYRPSFIACTNALQEDDLIFMERCFQRTLLEYEKFMAYSGTPTIVWRRTGQIAAVGTEFCVLTGWPQDRLLNEHTFIVELMDDDSVIKYFEMFSTMAFGDSRDANMLECTLLTPQGKKIKTSSIWTLKRDVFGIPMMIVGNFLPITT